MFKYIAQTRLCVNIIGKFGASGAIGYGWAVVAGFPEAEMPQDLFDNAAVFDEADDSHFPPAFLADQRIDLVNLLAFGDLHTFTVFKR